MTAAHVPVLVVGGGPVGLTLAGELGWRGVPCLLVEERPDTTAHPKATLLGARSMELYRRWGIDDAIHDRALPPDHDYHIVFCTRLAEHELYRFTSPSIGSVRRRDPAAHARFRELAWSPYGKTQIGQQELEPVLHDFAASHATNDVRRGWRCTSFCDRGPHVEATITDVVTGAEETVTADYLVGCDGGTSGVRRQLGARYTGRGALRRNVSFYFRSPDFLSVHGKGMANLYFVFTPGSFGVFTAIDGAERWNYQHYFLDPDAETEHLDAADVLHRAVGVPFPFELLAVTHWRHHQSVATAWRRGRTFLAGDAAHLFVPTGGVGMNTGIGDAVDLAWKLDAVLAGWGGPRLLDSYEQERKPVAIRNSLLSVSNSDKIDMVMDETPVDIDREDAEGERLRGELAAKIRWLSRQFNSAGVHLGYRYVDSPIVAADGTPEPPDDPMQVVPSTWPGSRLPHAWLADGSSTLDLVGRHHALLRAAGQAAPTALIAAATAAAVPLVDVALADPAAIEAIERPYVLVRPDGHIAWRDRDLPADPGALIDRVRGAAGG